GSLITVTLSFFSSSFFSSPRLRPSTSRRWGEERRHQKILRATTVDEGDRSEMKKVEVFAAFLTAASFADFAIASHDPHVSSSFSKEVRLSSLLPPGSGSSREGNAESGSRKGVEDKFTSRFDGLRFIEALMTTHQ
ncbi:hypothetical protein BHE74_00007302, partial [Ensete ventricosum]